MGNVGEFAQQLEVMGSGQGQVAIRKAVSDDCEEVARIYVISWNAGFGHLMGHRKVDPEIIGRWRQDLASPPPSRWWIAEFNWTTVGFAGNGPSRDPVEPSLGELDTIAVDPVCWRTGVGRAPMSRCLRFLSEDGYAEAVLWTPANYPRGASFYHAPVRVNAEVAGPVAHRS